MQQTVGVTSGLINTLSLPRLRSLELRHSEMLTPILQNFSTLTSLEDLCLRRASGAFVPWQATRIRSFHVLPPNPILDLPREDVFRAVHACTNMTSLNLGHVWCPDIRLDLLVQLRSLHYGSVFLHAHFVTSTQLLSLLTNLERLFNLACAAPLVDPGLTRVTMLSLSDPPVPPLERALQDSPWSYLRSLRIMSMNARQFTRLDSLSAFQYLEHLTLDLSPDPVRINWNFLAALPRLHSLEMLKLPGNPFPSCCLPSLTRLRCAYNLNALLAGSLSTLSSLRCLELYEAKGNFCSALPLSRLLRLERLSLEIKPSCALRTAILSFPFPPQFEFLCLPNNEFLPDDRDVLELVRRLSSVPTLLYTLWANGEFLRYHAIQQLVKTTEIIDRESPAKKVRVDTEGST